MAEVTRVDFYGETVIDIGPAKADILTALTDKGVAVPTDCLMNDIAALILSISHNIAKQETDGTGQWMLQPEIAEGYMEQRFNE